MNCLLLSVPFSASSIHLVPHCACTYSRSSWWRCSRQPAWLSIFPAGWHAECWAATLAEPLATQDGSALLQCLHPSGYRSATQRQWNRLLHVPVITFPVDGEGGNTNRHKCKIWYIPNTLCNEDNLAFSLSYSHKPSESNPLLMMPAHLNPCCALSCHWTKMRPGVSTHLIKTCGFGTGVGSVAVLRPSIKVWYRWFWHFTLWDWQYCSPGMFLLPQWLDWSNLPLPLSPMPFPPWCGCMYNKHFKCV